MGLEILINFFTFEGRLVREESFLKGKLTHVERTGNEEVAVACTLFVSLEEMACPVVRLLRIRYGTDISVYGIVRVES